jgi:poly(A) polymerase
LSRASSDSDAEAARALLRRPDVARLLAALNRDGEEARIVGGAVRDALMGRPVGDIDIAATVLPGQVMAMAKREGWKAVPTGIEHGTITIVIDGAPYEVTTLRRDVATDGRRATVAFTRDFREDAFRRDFTINAQSLSPDGEVHDYATGRADARGGIIRFMGDAETRIREDYLRILRFFRFFASHGHGAPDAEGYAACGRLKAGMAQLSRERVRQELLKLLVAERAVAAARAMDGIGLWPLLLPGVSPNIAALDALATLEAGLGLAPDPVVRLAAVAGSETLLQDVLKLSNQEQARLETVNAFAAGVGAAAMSEGALRALVFRVGAEGFEGALRLGAARHGLSLPAFKDRLRAAAPLLARPPVNPFRSADAAALGVAPGPRMGRVLNAAAELWLAAGLPEDAAARADLLRRAVESSRD